MGRRIVAQPVSRKDRPHGSVAEQMAKYGVKPLYYYDVVNAEQEDRFEGHVQTITVETWRLATCLLLKKGKVVARGIMPCDPRDNFCRRTGRTKATGMALAALFHKDNGRKFTKMGGEPFYKSVYMPVLNEREEALVEAELNPKVRVAKGDCNCGCSSLETAKT